MNFGALPLIEAAVRVSFREPQPFGIQVIDAIRGLVKGDFPGLADLAKYEVPPGVGRSSLQIGPGSIAGIVYTGHDKGLSLTAQSQLVSVRWRQQVTSDAPKYPRYGALRDALWDGVSAFRNAIGNHSAELAAVNLIYTNFLGVSDAAGILKDYFSERAQIKATDEAMEIQKVEFAWREPDSIDLRFKLEKASIQKDEESKSGFELTTIAGILLENGADPTEALDRVHDRLLEFFENVISERAKREWQLQEGNDA